jgi:hypothetical protein
MTLLEKIDHVFEWLYLNSGTNPNLHDIKTGLANKDIDIGEIRDILLKLKNDNFIYCEFSGNLNHSYHDNAHFLINFEGKYFYETVGSFSEKIRLERVKLYAIDAQNRRMERNEERLIQWTKYLFYGTVAVAVGAVGLVIWEILKTIYEHCH